jgi:hypothetical protein
VEAAIHYSGLLNVQFGGGLDYHSTILAFPLDQPGDSFQLAHYVNKYHDGIDIFTINGIASAACRGLPAFHFNSFYVSKLRLGQRISTGSFTQRYFGILSGDVYAGGSGGTQWKNSGYGFIGFRFNNGAGIQYGWARIKIANIGFRPRVPFLLFDYAYGDPGEPVRAGQTSSNEQAPYEGSLGWLALGATGLLAWRKRRSQAAS